jgi:hypothetical protein
MADGGRIVRFAKLSPGASVAAEVRKGRGVLIQSLLSKNLLIGWNQRVSKHPDQPMLNSRHMRDLKVTVLAIARAPILVLWKR